MRVEKHYTSFPTHRPQQLLISQSKYTHHQRNCLEEIVRMINVMDAKEKDLVMENDFISSKSRTFQIRIRETKINPIKYILNMR